MGSIYVSLMLENFLQGRHFALNQEASGQNVKKPEKKPKTRQNNVVTMDQATNTDENQILDEIFGTPNSSIFNHSTIAKKAQKLKTPFRDSLLSLRRSMPILIEVSEKSDKLLDTEPEVYLDLNQNKDTPSPAPTTPTPQVTIAPLNLELTPMPKSSDCNA